MGNVNFVEMIMRSTGAFIALLVMTRIMGKKQMSQLTFFNYVTGITIGGIAADIASESETPYWNGFISLIWWALLTIAVGYISLKFSSLRVAIDGQPTIVIKNGLLQEKAISRLRMNLDDLNMLLRERGTFSIKEVDYAIMEPNGKLSLLKNQEEQSPTRKDMNLPVQPLNNLPTELIVDGRIMEKNLTNLGLDHNWLRRKLQNLNPEHVFYAEHQPDGTLFYQQKE